MSDENKQHQGEPVAFHMGDAMRIFDLLATEQISRKVDNAHLGAMGATEVTRWKTKLGLTLIKRSSNGGESVEIESADPSDVERLRNCLRTEIEAGDSWKREAEDLRAQLAERDALLREKYMGIIDLCEDQSWWDRVGELLSLPRAWVYGLSENPNGWTEIKRSTPSAEPIAPNDCAVCTDLGELCLGCEQGEVPRSIWPIEGTKNNRKTLVLGSAPGAQLPDGPEDYFVIAANGSISSFPDLVPDVLLLNGYALVDASGVGPETRANLRCRSVKKLIVIDNLQNRSKSVEQHIQEIGIKFEQLEVWSKEQRVAVCVSSSGIQYPGLGGNDIPSTGVTAICYALGLSEDVTVSGIDVDSNGHNYSKGNFMRGHLDMDRATLSAISGRIKIMFVRIV